MQSMKQIYGLEKLEPVPAQSDCSLSTLETEKPMVISLAELRCQDGDQCYPHSHAVKSSSGFMTLRQIQPWILPAVVWITQAY